VWGFQAVKSHTVVESIIREGREFERVIPGGSVVVVQKSRWVVVALLTKLSARQYL
jgi:hypothetical protein